MHHHDALHGLDLQEDAALRERRAYTGRAEVAAGLGVDRADLLGDPQLAPLPRADGLPAPPVVAAHAHAKDAAAVLDGELRHQAVPDEVEPHELPLANHYVAFFRISRSVRSWRFSASSSLTRCCSAASPPEALRCEVRAAAFLHVAYSTQPRSVLAGTPSPSAALGLGSPCVLIISTAESLNSCVHVLNSAIVVLLLLDSQSIHVLVFILFGQDQRMR